MNRRHALGLGAGAAAMAAGVGIGIATRTPELWLDEGFWQMKLRSAAGGETLLADFRGKKLLVNFWATWCAPCIREMPALDRFQARFGPEGWQVLGLAVDSIAPVLLFSQKLKVSYPLLVAEGEGLLLSRRLGNPGGLPYTVLADARGRVRFSKAGETTLDEMAREAARLSAV